METKIKKLVKNIYKRYGRNVTTKENEENDIAEIIKLIQEFLDTLLKE